MAIYGCKQAQVLFFYFTLVQSLMSSWVNPDDSPKKGRKWQETCSKHAFWSAYAKTDWVKICSFTQRCGVTTLLHNFTCSTLAATKKTNPWSDLVRHVCVYVYWLELQRKIFNLSSPLFTHPKLNTSQCTKLSMRLLKQNRNIVSQVCYVQAFS